MSVERNLGESFNEYFAISPALDAASREDVYRIRHEVYCRDLGWEAVREDGMETDGFDAQSVHLLLTHKASGMLVGCTRLVLTDPADRAKLLPFEKSCAAVLDRSRFDPSAVPRDSLGEISRLAVMRDFRQRKGENQSALAMSSEDFEPRGPQSRFPFIPMGLYMGVAAVADRLNIEYNFLLTEPRLAQHFARIGLFIEPAGGEIEHRGVRSPWLLRRSQVIPNLRPLVRSMYDVIQLSVNAAFDRAAQA
jgi:N-acyl amino acid synthase of PEP-CTERM/exosortase system